MCVVINFIVLICSRETSDPPRIDERRAHTGSEQIQLEDENEPGRRRRRDFRREQSTKQLFEKVEISIVRQHVQRPGKYIIRYDRVRTIIHAQCTAEEGSFTGGFPCSRGHIFVGFVRGSAGLCSYTYTNRLAPYTT